MAEKDLHILASSGLFYYFLSETLQVPATCTVIKGRVGGWSVSDFETEASTGIHGVPLRGFSFLAKA